MLSHKFKPHRNRMVLSLNYLKLKRKSHEFTQELIGRLQTKTADCDYNEYDRRLPEQFIYGQDVECMIRVILREVSAL